MPGLFTDETQSGVFVFYIHTKVSSTLTIRTINKNLR